MPQTHSPSSPPVLYPATHSVTQQSLSRTPPLHSSAAFVYNWDTERGLECQRRGWLGTACRTDYLTSPRPLKKGWKKRKVCLMVKGTYQSSGSQPEGALWERWVFLTTEGWGLPEKMKKKVKLAWLRKQNWLRCVMRFGWRDIVTS